jgi:hypothetical protein
LINVNQTEVVKCNTQSHNLHTVTFHTYVLVTQAHLDANDDGKARLEALAAFIGSGTDLPLATDLGVNYVQLALIN